MSTNQYTWVIEQLDCRPTLDGLTNVVENVHWRVNATDGKNHNATVYGTQGLTAPDTGTFIQYSDLTLDQVVAWVQDAMGLEALDNLYAGLDSNIENQITPAVVYPALPWSSAS